MPDDRDDWYVVELAGSADLTVELTDFQPLVGQLAVFKGNTCGTADFIDSVGGASMTKMLDIGPQGGGKYFIYVSNDGPLNNSDAYQLYVRYE